MSAVFENADRRIEALVVVRWGRVERVDGVVPWLVFDDGAVVDPIRCYLVDFVAQGNRPWSVRSYAYDLLRWWRWLRTVGVEWDKATPAEGRDLVLWMMQAEKPRNALRTKSVATVGTVNPVTRKQYLNDRYTARTIRHANAVVREFYEFWIERGQGPLLNPMPLARRSGRPYAHHNPLEAFRPAGRLRYNPKLPKQLPRAIPDDRWRDLFGILRSNRDRALLSLTVSNGARAGEILGLRLVDVDWGDQRVRVIRKGTRAEQWLPASAESFVWLRLYIADVGDGFEPSAPLWRTQRRRREGNGDLAYTSLTYDALRKVLVRANDALNTNWTMHDLRHTAALRMARDDALSARDIQCILGHAHLSTTTDIYMVEDADETIIRVQRHLADRDRIAEQQVERECMAEGYDDEDLRVLFGGSRS